MKRLHHLVLLVALLLAACAQSAAAPPTAPPAPPSPTLPAPAATSAPPTATRAAPTMTPPPSPTPTPAPLTIWAAGDETRLDALSRLIDEAAAETGVTVRVSVSSSDALIALLRVAQLDDQPLPDVIWGTGDDLAIVRAAGLIQPVPQPAANARLLPAVVTGASADGKRWGVPLGAQGFLLLYYNRELVETPPRDIDALIAIARANTGGNRVGLIAGWIDARWFALWLDMLGGTMLDPQNNATLDTPEAIATLELLRTLRRFGPTPPSTYDQGARLFRRGQAALAIDGDWALQSFQAVSDTLDLGVAPLPLTGGGRQAVAPLTGVYLMYGATLDAARLSQAEALAATLTEDRWQARIARDLGILPASITLLSDPAVTGDPALAAAAQYAANAPGIPPTRPVRCAWDAVEVALPPFLLGQRNAADTAAAMQSRAEDCIARN